MYIHGEEQGMQNRQGGASICVFVRHPVPGRVKTRLAAGIGPQAACDFYRACASYTLQLAGRCSCVQATIHFSAADEASDIQGWMESLGLQHMARIPQSADPCLGIKLRRALEYELRKPGVHKALVIGSDIPGLTEEVIATAVEALDSFEVVLGPAVDGGYYLLGIKGPHVEPSLFEGIEWSTASVLQQTLDKAARAGLQVAPIQTLPTLQDIDTVDDLRAWRQSWQQCSMPGVQSPQVRMYTDVLRASVDQILE